MPTFIGIQEFDIIWTKCGICRNVMKNACLVETGSNSEYLYALHNYYMLYSLQSIFLPLLIKY